VQETKVAVVCTVRDAGESDRLAVLFGPECGKVLALVRGARKPKSKLAGLTRPFSEGRFFLRPGRINPLIVGVDIVRTHKKVQADVRKLAVGSLWLELLASGHWPEDMWEPLFRLTTNALTMLAETEASRELASVVAAKIIKLSGQYPSVSHCAKCAEPIYEGDAVFDRGYEVAWHMGCAPMTSAGDIAGHIVSAEILGAIYRLYDLPLGRFDSGWSGKAEASEVEKSLWKILSALMDTPIKSRRFLEEAHGW